MDPFVLDSSFSLAWCFLDERNDRTESVRELLRQTFAVVPPLWRWELCNGLVVAKRGQRISLIDVQQALAIFEALPIRMDLHTVDHTALFHLADQYQLTAYDAAYLELAKRLNAPLATLDQALARAAIHAGIKVF